MDYMQQVLDRLTSGEALNSEMIKKLIDGHADERKRMIKLHERYKATKKGVPILTREFEDFAKINNKLNNDFFSDVIDTKVGYFAGRPISLITEDFDDNLKAEVDIFSRRNNLPDLDSETVKMMAICGSAYRLLYMDTMGNERVVNIPPWEVIVLHEDGIDVPIYAMRYYEVERFVGNAWQEVTMVEWYDDTDITFWVERAKGQSYILEDTTPHNFDFNPVIGFSNNEELQGDCEKVLALIDGYDRTLSDANSEIEQFRLAYLATYGVELDEDTLNKAKRTGAFGFPDSESKMEWIVKNMDVDFVNSHLDRLEDNIMRFAKSINLADEQFSGTSSGVALRYKMFALESKCITVERKMTAALRRMFQVLASAWAKRNLNFDYLLLDFQFTRNFPLNLLDEAQTSATFKGLISDRTRLSLLSFIEDVNAEMERMEEEYEPPLIQMAEDEEDEPDEI